MKKYLGALAILMTLVSCSTSTILSSDRNFFEKNITKSKIEEKVKGRFDYNKDIAVASKASKTAMSAKINAEQKMYDAIYNYSYKILSQLILDSNVTGKGFDDYQMKKYAIEIADRYTREAVEIGKFKDDKNKQYYVALKINKEEIKQQTIRIFKERVNRVIERLNELKEGIN